MNASTNLITRLDNICSKGMDPDTVRQALTCLMDHMGTAECGKSLFGDHREKYLSYFDSESGDDTGEASIKDEAFLRAYFAHILELDDGCRSSMSHPGAVIFGALLPVAAAKRISGKDLIRGIVCGYETAIRLGTAVQPSHKKKKI